MLTCLYDVVGYALLGSMCFMCLFPCYSLDLCLHMSICLDLRSLHALCYIPCACALHAMFMCLGLGYVCHVMCYCSPLVPFIASSCVLAYWFGPDLDPMVFVVVHTPKPTSRGLDHPIFMSMLACFYTLYLC